MDGIEDFMSRFLRKDLQFLSKGDPLLVEMHSTIPPPWHDLLAIDTSLELSLHGIWQPIEPINQKLVFYITTNTADVRLVVDVVVHKPLGLLYAINTSQAGVRHYLAGIPLSQETRTTVEGKLVISLPSPFVEFSNIHNGFLANGESEFGIRSAAGLYYLNNLPAFDEGDFNYDPARLLGFCGDGAANEQCFSLDHPTGNDDYQTFDWDHETRMVTRPRSFWDFVTEFITVV